MVRAFGLYWGGIRFESLSTHHCWSLSKSFIPSLVVWSMTKNNAFGGEKQNKKSNGEQSDLCDLEQVTLKPQLQVHHYLNTWLQIWYHSLLWGDSIRKGADLEKQNCLFGVHPAVMGKLTSLFSLPLKIEIHHFCVHYVIFMSIMENLHGTFGMFLYHQRSLTVIKTRTFRNYYAIFSGIWQEFVFK